MRIQNPYTITIALIGITGAFAQVVNPDVITCAIKDASVGIACPRNNVLLPDETCCRYHDNCGTLPKCQSKTCCGSRASGALTLNTGYTYDESDPNVITCQIKENSGSWKCREDEPIFADKVCCRWSGGVCGTLPKCRRPFCCQDYVFRPELEPSPSAVPDPNANYEPVNHVISCGISFLEDGLSCDSQQILDEEKECCRFEGQCDEGVPTCSKSECCERVVQVSPSATPTSSPAPVSYQTTCGERDSIVCDSGSKTLSDKECCEFEDFCDTKSGSLPHCSTAICCDVPVVTEIEPEPTPAPTPASTTTSTPAPRPEPEDKVEPEPEPDRKPTPPPSLEGSSKVCNCGSGVALTDRCYGSLAKAIDAARNGDTVFITGEVRVKSPIRFRKDLNFKGINCGNKQPVVIAGFDSKKDAILEPRHKSKQTIVIENLAFTGMPNKKSAAFHARGSETSAGSQSIDLTLLNVQIYDMLSERPGVGVFIGKASNLYIDESCVFRNLRMVSNIKSRYAGGAALAVILLPKGSDMVVNGLFLENESRYPKSSRHAGGGAVYLDWMAGRVELKGTFTRNIANQGGGVHIQDVIGDVLVSGRFMANEAIDDGFGARSGAFRVLKQHKGSEIELSGHFAGNKAQGRSGVMASNVMPKGSVLKFSGTFVDNVASHKGGVWSAWTSTVVAGKIVLDSKAKFERNTSAQDDNESSLFDIAGEGARTMSDAEWKGRRITIN